MSLSRWQQFIFPMALAVLLTASPGAGQGTIDEKEGQKILPITVQSVAVKGPLPLADPLHQAWGQAAETTVKLIRQEAQEPKLAKASVERLRVRVLHNDGWIAFRLEWQDPTPSEVLRIDRFADGAAVELPMKTTPLPDYRMGSDDKPVHLLLWRADRQWTKRTGKTFLQHNYPRVRAEAYAFEPRVGTDRPANQPERHDYLAAKAAGNPIVPGTAPVVEELNATTWNELTVQAQQNARGSGVYRNGRWFVVLARPLVAADPSDAPLLRGAAGGLVAFAVWDGGQQNVASRKMVTEGWLKLRIGQ